MNHNIPQYDFYKHKYGDELLIDVVPLNTIKKYLKEQPVHILTYYDITLITSGEGEFLIDHQANRVKPQDIIFTRPGEIRKWDDKTIQDGFALIFEEEFLLSFFNDPAFLRNLSYFHTERRSSKLSLHKKAYARISGLIWARTANFCEPKTCTWATPLTIEIRWAIIVSAYSSSWYSGSVVEVRARNSTG